MKFAQMLSRLDPKRLEKALDDWFDPKEGTMTARKAVFTASADSHLIFNGFVEVIRKLKKSEADSEVGPMFRCRSEYGMFDAFGDELCGLDK